MNDVGKPASYLATFVQRMLCSLTSPRAVGLIGERLFWIMGRKARDPKIKLSEVNRVLVVRLDEIGDVVLTTPFLRELRRNLPEAWITLVVKPQLYNLVELCPYVNEVLTYDWSTNGTLPWHTRQLRRHWRALRLAWQTLWGSKFDLAVLPRWDTDFYHATFVAYFSGAPWRVAYSEQVTKHKQQLNNKFDRLLTHVLGITSLKHEVERNLDVIRFLGGKIVEERLELWMGQKDEEYASQILAPYGIREGKLMIAFGLGAGAQKRQWPLTNFVELGIWMKKKYPGYMLLIGGPRDESLGHELQQQLGDTVINTAGRTTLRQACALLKRCHLYVGNDAGPMHLAVSMGVPVVEISCHPLSGSLFHANSPVRFGPWERSYRVLQPQKALPPCIDGCLADRAHCILGVTVEHVKETAMALLPGRAGSRSVRISNLGCLIGFLGPSADYR